MICLKNFKFHDISLTGKLVIFPGFQGFPGAVGTLDIDFTFPLQSHLKKLESVLKITEILIFQVVSSHFFHDISQKFKIS